MKIHTIYKRAKKSISIKHIVVFLLLILVTVEGVVMARSVASEEMDENIREVVSPLHSHEEDMLLWESWFDQYGADEAYVRFKEQYANENYGTKHFAAHLFGDLLYKREGIPGVAVCDSSFAFGCYHSFFGRAILDHGLDVITELDASCIEKWGELGLGCPHGIGHGVLSYLGDEKLLESLEACRTLNYQEPIGGCTSGVFMEYNFKTMESLEGGVMREFDETDPHKPCSDLPSEFLEACYWDLPQWWEKVLSYDYSLIDMYCSEISEQVVRDACYRGLGNAIGPSTRYDIKKTSERCYELKKDESKDLCLSGASWSFFAEPSVRHLVKDVCREMTNETDINMCIERNNEIR